MADLKNTIIADVGSINLPSGTTAQRPTNPPDGATRFNTDLGYTECYYRGFWFDLTTGMGSLQGGANLVYLLDASIPASTNGTTGFRWKSIGPVAGRDFDFYGTPTYVSDGLRSYWRFDESSHATCENVCATNYSSVEVVFRRYANNPEDILINKENTWEIKTDSATVQWAWYGTDRAWYWSNSGSIVDNNIYHVMITYDGNNVTSYVNGRRRQIDTAYDNGVHANQTAAYPKLNARGDPRDTRSNPGSHDIFMTALYDRPLNDYEVYANYAACVKRFNIPYNAYN